MFVLNEQSENNRTRHTHTHSTHEFTRQKSTHFIHNLIGLIAIKKRNKKKRKGANKGMSDNVSTFNGVQFNAGKMGTCAKYNYKQRN